MSTCLDNIETTAQIVQLASNGADAHRNLNIFAFRVHRLINLTVTAGLNVALGRLLNLTRSSRTSDPKDKVYGLLGIIDPSISSLVDPDYSLSVLIVYANFAKCLIVATGGLDVVQLDWTCVV